MNAVAHSNHRRAPASRQEALLVPGDTVAIAVGGTAEGTPARQNVPFTVSHLFWFPKGFKHTPKGERDTENPADIRQNKIQSERDSSVTSTLPFQM